MSDSPPSDKGAAFTGLIVTSLALLVMVLGIVKWTNNKFAGHEGAKDNAKVEAAH